MPIERKKEIKRRRKRKAQIRKYKTQYYAANDPQLKEHLLERIRRREPFFKPE